MSLGCPQTELFSQCVTSTALCKHHRDCNISSGSSYSLSLCLTSPEESDSVFLSNMDTAQRPWDFVNGGILLPTRCSVRFKPGGSVTREQPLCKHPRSLSCSGGFAWISPSWWVPSSSGYSVILIQPGANQVPSLPPPLPHPWGCCTVWERNSQANTALREIVSTST